MVIGNVEGLFEARGIGKPVIHDLTLEGIPKDERALFWTSYVPTYHRTLGTTTTQDLWRRFQDVAVRSIPRVSDGQPSYALDMGCGDGRITEALLAGTKAHIVAVDGTRAFLDRAQERLSEHRDVRSRVALCQMDLTQDPWQLPGDSFSMATANFVIQYLSRGEQEYVINRAAQALNIGGELLLSTFTGVPFKKVVPFIMMGDAVRALRHPSRFKGIADIIRNIPVTKRFDQFAEAGLGHNSTLDELDMMHTKAGLTFEVVDEFKVWPKGTYGVITRGKKF